MVPWLDAWMLRVIFQPPLLSPKALRGSMGRLLSVLEEGGHWACIRCVLSDLSPSYFS